MLNSVMSNYLSINCGRDDDDHRNATGMEVIVVEFDFATKSKLQFGRDRTRAFTDG